MMVLLESCRHPFTEDQVTRVETYATHLGEHRRPGPHVGARAHPRRRRARALADYMRFSDEIMADIAEPSLIAEHMGKDDPAPELAARLRSFHDLPEGTLGRAYVEFCDRNNLTYPGDNPNSPAVFVAHDMTHVITGYEPTGPGELALGAFQISMNDSDAHWVAFLGSIAIHEAGYFNEQRLRRQGEHADAAGRDRDPGRGVRPAASSAPATSPPSTTSAMADRPLADVRAEYNVGARRPRPVAGSRRSPPGTQRSGSATIDDGEDPPW